MLTDRAQGWAEHLVVWIRFGGFVLIVYAIAQRVPLVDALAGTFAFVEVLRAVASRAASSAR